ncbi:MAG: sensor histidine kinase [Candidatus Krumholzibacteriia bacterium]
MRFNHKIMMMPVLAGLTFLVLFIVTDRVVREGGETIARIEGEFFHGLQLSQDLENTMLRIRHLLTEAVITGNEDPIGEAEALAAHFRAVALDCRDVPLLRSSLQDVLARFDAYFGLAHRTTAALVTDEQELALDFSRDLLDQVQAMNTEYRILEGELDRLVADTNTALAGMLRDTGRRVTVMRRAMTLVSALLVVALVVISAAVVASIVRPVGRMSRVALAIAGGDLEQELNHRSDDALGELADSFREMQRSLIADIERREKAEADLLAAQGRIVQSEKMVLMGQLVAGLAHELNSPLGTLTSAVDVVVRSRGKLVDQARRRGVVGDLEGDPDFGRAMQAMDRGLSSAALATRRIDELVVALKSFAQLDRAEVQSVDLNEVLRNCLRLLTRGPEARAQVTEDLTPVEAVLGHPVQLNQLFFSLVRRSLRDAGRDGRLSLATRQMDGEVLVVVEDSGRGYDAGELRRLFDPGFGAESGRMQMDWTMIGNARIVAEHGGRIDAHSRPGEGTRYEIRIPLWGRGNIADPAASLSSPPGKEG